MKPSLVQPLVSDDCSTLEVARLLGLAVRSVQMMVDRGELEAWKTSGGHRRISRASVERWLSSRHGAAPNGEAHLGTGPRKTGRSASRVRKVLLIEDSNHYQNLITLLLRKQFPDVDLHVANNGITGLVMYGQLQPDVLIVDILLPGIDGATLITSLRSQAQFTSSSLIVVTSLDVQQRAPFELALEGVPVIHKPRLVAELPPLLTQSLQAQPAAPAGNVVSS